MHCASTISHGQHKTSTGLFIAAFSLRSCQELLGCENRIKLLAIQRPATNNANSRRIEWGCVAPFPCKKPYPNCGQNMRFSLPYLWPGARFLKTLETKRQFLFHFYLKTERCIQLKRLGRREPLFIFRICE